MNNQLAPYIQKGAYERMTHLEEEYSSQGLKENFSKEEFENKFLALKRNFTKINDGETFGPFGQLLEKIVVPLSFLVGLLSFVNIFLVLTRNLLFDVCMKSFIFAVVAFLVFLYWYMLHQMSFAFRFVAEVARLVSMLRDTASMQVPDASSMLRATVFSQNGIFFSCFVLLFYFGVPCGLYAWIQKREKISSWEMNSKRSRGQYVNQH